MPEMWCFISSISMSLSLDLRHKILVTPFFSSLIISFITIIPIIPITALQINQASELSKDDNVTSTIKPQGTSIGSQNETSMTDEDKSQTTSTGNVTSTIKPQGTSIDKS